MLNVFLDTNILLEIVLNRKYKYSCQQILQAGINSEIRTHASILTFANMAYVLEKEKIEKPLIYSILRDLESVVNVIEMNDGHLRKSLQQEVKDFEDMLQYQCAISSFCDCIVTINTKHFSQFCNIPLYKPDELAVIIDKQ